LKSFSSLLLSVIDFCKKYANHLLLEVTSGTAFIVLVSGQLATLYAMKRKSDGPRTTKRGKGIADRMCEVKRALIDSDALFIGKWVGRSLSRHARLRGTPRGASLVGEGCSLFQATPSSF